MRKPRSIFSTALAAAACLLTLTLAASPSAAADSSNFPAIDFDALGALGVVGNFVGLEIYNASVEVQPIPSANGSSLVIRAPNGTLTTIGSTNPNASINAVTTGGSGSGPAPLVYVAGNFSQIGNTDARGIASYDPTSRSWDNLEGGLNGTAHALYYSAEHKALLVGGSFRTPVNAGDQNDAYRGSVALWNEQSRQWQPLNFGGLNGTVYSITHGFDPSFIRFTGSFLSLYGSGKNASSDTMNSPSSLTRVLQPYSLAMSQVSGGPPIDSPDYNNPLQILCPQGTDGPGNTFLFAAGIQGLLTVETFRVLQIAAIRLGNTRVGDRGLKGFSIVSLPDNQILELVYKDPATGANVTCSDNCILSDRTGLTYQDFLISPAQGGSKTLTGIQLRVNSFYGTGAGLHILELLSDGAWTWANNALNRGRCSSPVPGVNGTRSITFHNGDWDFTSVNRGLGAQQPILEFRDSYSNLATDVQNNVNVDFRADIPVDGNYTGYISIPGCLSDGSCGRRTLSLVTVYPTPDLSVSYQTYVNQTVEQDAIIKIFDGEVIGTKADSIEGATSFMPRVVLSIAPNATGPEGQNEFTIVADKISFQLRNSNETSPMTGPGFAFGLVEFDVFNSTAALPSYVNTTLTRSVATAGAISALGGANVSESGSSARVNALKKNSPKARQVSQSASTSGTSRSGQGSATATSASSADAAALPTGTTALEQYQSFALQLILPSFQNTTQTSFDHFATALFEAGVNGSYAFNSTELGAPEQAIRAVADVAGFTFVGGNFTSIAPVTNGSGFANLVGYNISSNGQNLTRLNGGGLNGRVLALAGDGNILYVGGGFTALADSPNSSVPYFGKYDVLANSWLSTGSALDGPVTSLTVMPNSTLLLTGAFTAANGTLGNGGIALYNTSSGSWIQQDGLLSGTVNAAAVSVENTDGRNQTTTYLVGPISAVSDFAVPGAAKIEPATSDNSFPAISALNFAFLKETTSTANNQPNLALNGTVLFNGTIALQNGTLVAPNGTIIYQPTRGRQNDNSQSAAARLANRVVRRAAAKRATQSPKVKRELRSQQRLVSAIEPEILSSSDGTNEIYASAFWARADGSYLQIVGGNFTTSGNVVNLGAYDPVTKSLSAFPAVPSNLANFTTVRALLVIGNQIFVGGDGGIASYNFVEAAWDNTTTPLSSDTQTPLVVRSIVHRPDTSEIYVGGAFDNAGSLPCSSVCMWDNSQLRWNPLGTSLDGDIAVLDFAGSKASTLVAAGNLQVANTPAPVAMYDTTQDTWVALGAVGADASQAPGPATAMSVDNLQLNSIFVGGRSQDGLSPYLAKWDGTRYNLLGNDELRPATGIQQLTFVPLLKAHSGNNILENNRLLVVSGVLELASFGNVSSAFYDGSSWQPFLLGAGSDGTHGIVRAVVRATEVLKFANLRRLATGLVILISIAIGLGLVFLLTLLGLLWAMARRNKNKGVDAPLSAYDDVPGEGEHPGRPSSLLATLNAATENVMGANAAPGSGGHGSNLGAGAGVAGLGAGAAAAAAAGAAATSSGHGRTDSGPLNTVENSDETGGPSTAYHSEGAQTGRSGASQYYTDDENMGAAEAAAGVGALGAGAAAAAAAGSHSGSEGVPARARYSFEATHESELSMHAGDQITILDDLDEHWWLARDSAGREGVVPSTYVL
ncbi:hypothetical protein A4X13_0g3677 [Tilletia indica]|uniref:Uncharacterized protein n=1 Tax=Tilletia indica TaxID=43049 RepID=A0A177TH37_9BASI|nr:hypothetical protein A4X13_0g3677 [Tilletia indica]